MPDTKRDFYKVCPTCWSVRVKSRIFKNPRYKCEACGTKFNNKKRISRVDRLLFNEIMKLARNDLEQTCKSVDNIILRKATVTCIKEYIND